MRGRRNSKKRRSARLTSADKAKSGCGGARDVILGVRFITSAHSADENSNLSEERFIGLSRMCVSQSGRSCVGCRMSHSNCRRAAGTLCLNACHPQIISGSPSAATFECAAPTANLIDCCCSSAAWPFTRHSPLSPHLCRAARQGTCWLRARPSPPVVT